MSKQPREISEKSLRLRSAARENDGFFSTFVLRKISRRITSLVVETRIKPNTVTFISIIIGLTAAYFAAMGDYTVGASLLLLSLLLDCVDGEVARYKNQFSTLGAWLDALSDRVKEFAYVAGLIYSAGEEKAWWLGMAIVILQTVRHLSDYNFVQVQKLFEGTQESSNKSNQRGVIYWVKKVLHLPIAERWLILALLPIITSVPTTLRTILYLGICSLAYVVIGRFRRMISWSTPQHDSAVLIHQRDTFLPIRITISKKSWAIPSLLRALEFFALVTLPLSVSPMTQFIMITSIALWHYANLYDALRGVKPAFSSAGLHMAGRILLIFLAHLFGLDVEVSIFLALYLLVLILVRGGHNVAKGDK